MVGVIPQLIVVFETVASMLGLAIAVRLSPPPPHALNSVRSIETEINRNFLVTLISLSLNTLKEFSDATIRICKRSRAVGTVETDQ